MKKLTLTTWLLTLSLSSAWAEDEDTTAADTPASSSSVVQADVERVMPTPQQTRIAGLIDRLSGNYGHEIETLNAQGTDFLGLFRESESGDPQGCLIMLHGDHGHPDWPQVISPIREQLPVHSWCTLSVEVPDIGGRATPVSISANEDDGAAPEENPALPNEETVFARIDAAVQLIRDKGYSQVAYMGYRTGAAYALRFAAERGTSNQALILIEPRTFAPVSEFDLAQNIERLRLPVLDYYFNRTARDTRFARQRQAAANKRTNRQAAYTQIDALPDARYDPSGNKRLVQRVWGFMKQNTNQQSQRKELPELDKELFYDSPND
ncbi:hypothetical protein MAQ5080_02684 [Marinomonas aquimarina]|uniref:Alpha/beta hydrolase family protein n=1 Tax=Marinomonas aquimarina TaxID=295068 RepID=A0A1A8TMH0_9GAMM|nr:DUF3530 family protein [Marinomonas aquimarina]SBS33787.1 hypothetical protein MAQ5080_02684 [Marinomonas aquimarina]